MKRFRLFAVAALILFALAACSSGGNPAGGSTGKLQVTIGGLPSGASASVSISGPNGYSKSITATTILNNLAVGSYTVTASNVTVGSTTYNATVTGSPASVAANQTAQVSVTYAVSGGGGGGGGGNGITGTVSAPQGGDTQNTTVEACPLNTATSQFDCDQAIVTTITQSGSSAPFSLNTANGTVYGMIAFQGSSSQVTAFGCYGQQGEFPNETCGDVTSPQSGIVVQLQTVGGGGGNGSGPLFPEFHGNLRQTTTTGGFQQSTVAVDASGTTHLLYAGLSPDGNSYPVRYGECSANCLSASSWTFITLGDYGAAGGGVRMALDASGNPRALWFSMADISSDGIYYYGQCDGGCTSFSNWQIIPVLTCSSADLVMCDALTNEGFALDPQGHPAFFMFSTSGTYYIYCDAADCTDTDNWKNSDDFTLTDIYSTLDLAFNASSQPRAVYSGLNGANDDFGYALCDSGCGQTANWQVVPVFELDYGTAGPFSFALNAEGQPRLVYYDNSSNSLTYAWCDSGCTDASDWGSAPTGLPQYSGDDGVKLVLDGSGTPAIAYSGAPNSASVESANVAVCTAGCESASPTWKAGQIDAVKDIQVPPPDPCETGKSFWQLGLEPSMALDASGGLHVSYATTSFFTCPGGQTPIGYPIEDVGTMYGPLRYAELH